MKKIFFICVLCLALCAASFVQAEIYPEDTVASTYGVSVDVVSRSIWRGQYWTNGLTWMPSVHAGASGFSTMFLGRMPLENVAYQGQFHLVMNDTSYRFESEGLGIKPGFITYFYPYVPGWSTTGEAYISLDYTAGGVTFATSHYFDVIDFQKAYYGDFSIAYHYDLSDAFNFGSTLSTGWGNASFNNPYSGLNAFASRYVSTELSLNSKLSEFIFVKPYFQYGMVIDGGLRTATGTKNLLSVGIVLQIQK